MLKHKILGQETKSVKYHGTVKFIIFECNTCGEHFSKMESYCKKQFKTHKNACCFCSARCRNIYINNLKKVNSNMATSQNTIHKKKFSFFTWLGEAFKE